MTDEAIQRAESALARAIRNLTSGPPGKNFALAWVSDPELMEPDAEPTREIVAATDLDWFVQEHPEDCAGYLSDHGRDQLTAAFAKRNARFMRKYFPNFEWPADQPNEL